jgi:hypothetical protein
MNRWLPPLLLPPLSSQQRDNNSFDRDDEVDEG